VIPRELFARPLSIAGLSIAADKLIAAAVAALCTVLIGWFYRFSRTALRWAPLPTTRRRRCRPASTSSAIC
jgi:NADH:ubiquinone oxidoreductase subunit 3 (subunit A)